MEGCIFCKIACGEIPSWKVHEDEHTYAFFDINPKNEYHTLVIPKSHYVNMFDVPEDKAIAVMKTIKVLVELYKERLGLKDVQIFNNSGKDAQQDVFHLHFHVVPRFEGDGQRIVWPLAKKELCDRFDTFLARLAD